MEMKISRKAETMDHITAVIYTNQLAKGRQTQLCK